MNLQSQEIGTIADFCALAISLLLIGLTFRTSRDWNLKMVSRFYLSHILVMIGYFLIYSLFSLVPLALSALIESLLNWLYHSHPNPSDGRVLSLSSRLILFGLFGGWTGAYFSYKNYLKQAE